MTLLLDLREMRGSEERVDRSCPPATFSADPTDGYAIAGDVLLALRVRKDGDKCHMSGRVCTTLTLACSRCLERFEMPCDLAVDLLYLPFSVNRGDGEHEIAEDDLSTAFYHDGRIDLGQMVREQFQLALPMKPLCRGDCRGLCPACGTNLNERHCGCDTRWRDPRLAALETLLPQGGPRQARRGVKESPQADAGESGRSPV